MRALLLAAGLLTAPGAWADCPDDPSASLREGVAAMETSFVQLDDAGFAAARERLEEALPCVAIPLDKLEVLSLHRAMALALFVDGDMRGSAKAWGAVKALRPDWELPQAMADEGTLLREIFDEAVPESDLVTLELAPVNGWLVDGSWTSDVPATRAFVLQGLGAEAVMYTGYELSVAGIPALDLVQPGPTPRMHQARLVGTGVAGGLAAGSLASLGIYLQASQRVDKVAYQQVDATAARGNAALGASVGLGAAAATTMALAWAVRW